MNEREAIDQMQIKAYSSVRTAVLQGKLIRPNSCPLCGSPGRIEAHHNDYHLLLDIRWMCRACHAKFHMENPDIGQAQPIWELCQPLSRQCPKCGTRNWSKNDGKPQS